MADRNVFSGGTSSADSGVTNVFLSHADTDAVLARQLSEAIQTRRANVQVFVSSIPGAIPTGKEWLSEIEQQLKAADAYLLLLTPASIARLWVWFEAGAAFMSGKKVIGICAPGMKKGAVPSPLSGHQLLSLDALCECVQVFKDLGADPANIETVVESMRSASEQATLLHLEASGWRGMMHAERYFAWSGPLESLADWNGVACPHDLMEVLWRSGMTPWLLEPGDLRSNVSPGFQQIFQTDRQGGKRAVIADDGRVLCVRDTTQEEKQLIESDVALWLEWNQLLDELERLSESTDITLQCSRSVLLPMDLDHRYRRLGRSQSTRAQLALTSGSCAMDLQLSGTEVSRPGHINAAIQPGYLGSPQVLYFERNSLGTGGGEDFMGGIYATTKNSVLRNGVSGCFTNGRIESMKSVSGMSGRVRACA
jgi:hypothetical protein